MSKLSVTKLTKPVEGSVQGPLAVIISDQKLAKISGRYSGLSRGLQRTKILRSVQGDAREKSKISVRTNLCQKHARSDQGQSIQSNSKF